MLLREVPIPQVISALRETLEQQAQIMAARLRGDTGPWTFGESEWKVLRAIDDCGLNQPE
jgi:hypothetical protein